MPTAGSFSDGELGFTSSKHGPNLRNTLTFQAYRGSQEPLDIQVLAIEIDYSLKAVIPIGIEALI